MFKRKLNAPSEFEYLHVEAVQRTNTPRNPYADGYGPKIPSGVKVQVQGSKLWRRVYVACWSNNGSAYVIIKGEHFLICGISGV